MALTSVQKGNIIETQIANILMLVSQGELSPFIPTVDDAGIDLIVTAKETFNTIFIQVKSRFLLTQGTKTGWIFHFRKKA